MTNQEIKMLEDVKDYDEEVMAEMRQTMAARLRELFAGKSSLEVANEIGGVGRQSVLYYLTGERNPKFSFIRKVADTYGVNANWLLGYPGAPKYEDVDTVTDKDVRSFMNALISLPKEERERLYAVAEAMYGDRFKREKA